MGSALSRRQCLARQMERGAGLRHDGIVFRRGEMRQSERVPQHDVGVVE